MNLTSLRGRITAWYGGLFAVALIVFGVAVWLGLRNYLINTLEATLRDEGANIVEQFVGHVEQKGPAWLTGEIEESYAPESDSRYIRVLCDNAILYQSKNSILRLQPVGQPDSGQKDGFFRWINSGSGGKIILYTTSWVSPSGAHYVVQAGAPTAPIDRILRSLLIALCLLTPVILAGAGIGGYLLMNVPFRPVVALTQRAEQIGTRALGERLPVIPTGDELERLSVSLNRMIDRLEEAVHHNRRFSADVSHELRTPLTILRGELEPLVDSPELPPQALDSIGSALEETLRMSDIVESLLTISKLDFRSPLPRSLVNLTVLALSTVEQMQLLAEDKPVTLRLEESGHAWVYGDPVRLKQVVVNLLDNAIKYTPAGGCVSLRVTSDRTHAHLYVSDNGIGIPAECLPFVFDRFYRADKARSRESGGAGLGLSIVKAICSAHEGTVSIQSRDGKGTTVIVDLPLGPAESNGRERERQTASSRIPEKLAS